MNKHTIVFTAVATISMMAGASGRADAARSPQAAATSACPYRYVVTDGARNNVTTYKAPHGKARQGAIRPNESFTVFIGGTSDQIAGRQRTDRGWVSFPRPFLRPAAPCGSDLSQASIEAAALTNAANASFKDSGQSLQNATR